MENLISKIQVGGTPYGIVIPEGLTEEQKAQVRQNIGAVSAQDVDVVRDGTYPDMTVGEAVHAQNADNSITSTNATNAVNATNAGQATKLSVSRAIDGVNFDGTASITHYCICSTAAGTAAKTVSITGFTLIEGARITVNFTTANSVSSPTLNVNGTGAKNIRCKGRSTGIVWKAEIVTFVYDGTYWQIIDGYSLWDKPVNAHHVQYNGESTPASLFGGTWAIDTDYTGRVLIGSGDGYNLGATGGEAEHTLTVAEMPSHKHNVRTTLNSSLSTGTEFTGAWTADHFGLLGKGSYDATRDYQTLYGDNTGNSQPHNNMQPYKVVGVWKRTA